jgi:hypothetical protein
VAPAFRAPACRRRLPGSSCRATGEAASVRPCAPRAVMRARVTHPQHTVRAATHTPPHAPTHRPGNDNGSSSGSSSDANRAKRRSTSKAANAPDTPPPAVQVASNMAAGSGPKSSSSSGGGSGGGGGSAPPSPAAQLASNMAASQEPQSPAAQVANTMSERGPQATSSSSSSGSSGQQQPRDANDPASFLQQGIRAAADAAEGAIAQTAAAATGDIEAAANLTTQGLGAAEAAARNLSDAAQAGLNAAATVAGGAAGAAQGVAASARGDPARGRALGSGSSGGGAVTSGDFDTVNVRVPAQAWANATRAKGRVRDATMTNDFDEVRFFGRCGQRLARVPVIDACGAACCVQPAAAAAWDGSRGALACRCVRCCAPPLERAAGRGGALQGAHPSGRCQPGPRPRSKRVCACVVCRVAAGAGSRAAVR